MEISHLIGYILGLLMGGIMGILGGGGSILTVPILIYIFSLNTMEGTTLSLLVVGTAAAAGGIRYIQQKLTDVRIALWFGIPSVVGVFAAQAFIRPRLPEVIFHLGGFPVHKSVFILILFSLLMVFAAWGMIRPARKELAKVKPDAPNPLIVVAEGLAVGLLIGIVGAGGGFMIVPALVMLYRMPMKKAVGTSLLIIAANSLFGFIGGMSAIQEVHWNIIVPFTAFSLAGILIGSSVSRKIPGEKLKPLFGWFVLLMAAYIILRTVLVDWKSG